MGRRMSDGELGSSRGFLRSAGRTSPENGLDAIFKRVFMNISQKQPQEASEFIRMEERGKPLSSNLFVVPDERRVSFQPLC